jgi:hypothetical protein
MLRKTTAIAIYLLLAGGTVTTFVAAVQSALAATTP